MAQMTITDVVNYGSRIGSGLPGYGIAQGALFAVTGSGVGPAQSVQGTFPLTTDAGLGGVTISVSVGGSTAYAIMVYVAPNEVDAILPSSTPLGTGTVTVNNNGLSASAPLTVVASAFGIFTSSGSGLGSALAFNVNGDGSTSQNAAAQSAQPGQTIMLSGTGLGAIASDETQPGATDVPNVNIAVWVGTQQATVMSAGRGTCCAGLDPSYPIPPGIAAWDIIMFVVPDSASGCQVSVTVQIGSQVSNFAPIAVAGGGLCPEIAQSTAGSLVTLQNPYKLGLVTMTRAVSNTSIGTGSSTNVTSDSASAQFFSIDLGMPVQYSDVVYSAYLKAAAGSCSVILARIVTGTPPPTTTPPPSGPTPVPLDAGPVINIVDPDMTKPMMPKNLLYSASAVITSITVPGLPPINSGGPGFYESSWTMNNGSGGADIGGFNVPMTSPQPITPVGLDQLTSITRGKDLPLSWTGGDPNGYMEITGSATSSSGGVFYSGQWYCMVHVGDGQFTVPGFVTAGLPAVASATAGTSGQGTLNFTPVLIEFIQIPGVDVANYISTWTTGKGIAYQ